MKYRDHRGGFKESMKTVREVNSIQELKEYLKTDEIKFEYCTFDSRNNWDTYYVLKKNNDGKFTVAGMSDGKFE